MNLAYKVIDTEYIEEVLTSVDEEKGGWDIGMGSLHGWCPKNESGVVPKVGSIARYYGRGLGFTVRGLDIDGQTVFYRTPDEQADEDRKWVANYEREQRETFEKNKDALDAEYAALPSVFQARIDRFRAEDPDFRWKSEAYELFCCTQAVAIANALKTPEKVEQFREMSWDNQKYLVPELSSDHSGNTFGGACKLAWAYLQGNPV